MLFRSSYWLADGFHRYHAHKQAGLDDIRVDLRQGNLREAILYSVGANAHHGLRRSNEDKRRAVLRLLEDPEWEQEFNGLVTENDTNPDSETLVASLPSDEAKEMTSHSEIAGRELVEEAKMLEKEILVLKIS